MEYAPSINLLLSHTWHQPPAVTLPPHQPPAVTQRHPPLLLLQLAPPRQPAHVCTQTQIHNQARQMGGQDTRGSPTNLPPLLHHDSPPSIPLPQPRYLPAPHHRPPHHTNHFLNHHSPPARPGLPLLPRCCKHHWTPDLEAQPSAGRRVFFPRRAAPCRRQGPRPRRARRCMSPPRSTGRQILFQGRV